MKKLVNSKVKVYKLLFRDNAIDMVHVAIGIKSP